MENRGFSLIELMVVVVIIGILATVAVPKLFGMLAKSKASEIGPAVGTYVKLQNAFSSVKGDSVGSWSTIGYFGPGTIASSKEGSETTNFLYGGAVVGTVQLTTSAVVGWRASNKIQLNECQASTAAAPNWVLSMRLASSKGGAVDYAPTTGSADCSILTPLFIKY